MARRDLVKHIPFEFGTFRAIWWWWRAMKEEKDDDDVTWKPNSPSQVDDSILDADGLREIGELIRSGVLLSFSLLGMNHMNGDHAA